MSATDKLLHVQHVTVEFRIGGLVGGSLLVAVNDVSFSLDEDRPEIFTLAGESGSGKTTLSRLLLRDLEPTRGKVLFEGRDLATIRKRSEFKEFMKKVQPVFQNPFETFSPLRRVDAYLFDTALNFGMAPNHRAAAQVVDDALRNVGLSLEEVSKRYPHELSGGQAQRVMIAMALACIPELLIADEPTTALDVTIQAQILDLMLELKQIYHAAIIMITHDLGVIAEVAQKVAVMYAGKIIEKGNVFTIFEKPLHPYTEGLIASLLDIENPVKSYRGIPGTVPNLMSPPAGCRFHPRCPKKMKKCDTDMPMEVNLGEDHIVSCWLY